MLPPVQGFTPGEVATVIRWLANSGSATGDAEDAPERQICPGLPFTDTLVIVIADGSEFRT